MGRTTRRLVAFSVVMIAGVVSAPQVAHADTAVSQTFGPTGSEQTYVIPAGVTELHIVAVGARGADGSGGGAAGVEGDVGFVVTADLPVPPGVTTLYVEVGETGNAHVPGFGGGGVGGFGAFVGGAGGGASDVRTCSIFSPCNTLESRLVVAGGGGGGGGYCVAVSCFDTSEDGGDGTATSGGSPGGPQFGSFGFFGTGGFGGPGDIGGSGAGGGGGGGWFGGGGGGGGITVVPLLVSSTGGNGGRGSNFARPEATNVTVAPAERDQQPSVTISYIVRSTTLTYTGDTTADFHDPATMSATLTETTTGKVVSGGPVTFTLNGAETCTANTDASGHASCTITPQEPAGTYLLVVTYPGDTTHEATTTILSFTVTHQETTTTYTGPSTVANGSPAELSALLLEEGDPMRPIAGRTVDFTLGSGATAQSCSGVTDSSGVASCTIPSVSQPLNANADVPVTASFAGDAFYEPSSDSATLKLSFMTGRAYGLKGTIAKPLGGNVTVAPTPDTGEITTEMASTTEPPCTVTLTGRISGRVLCASVVTTVNPVTSTGTASVAEATINTGILGVPVISASGVVARSHSACDSSSFTTTIAVLKINGVPLITLNARPNTTIPLPGPPGSRLILNEQRSVAGADVGQTVNAVHLIVPPFLGYSADVVVASATSDLHNCP